MGTLPLLIRDRGDCSAKLVVDGVKMISIKLTSMILIDTFFIIHPLKMSGYSSRFKCFTV